MGRTIVAAMIVVGSLWPSLSNAQTSSGPGPARGTPGAPRGGSFGATFRQTPPPPPSPPAPSAPTAGPIVPQAPPSALDSPVDVFRAGPRTYAPRYDRSARRNRLYGYGSGFSYVTDPFGYISQPESGSPRLDRYMSQGIMGYPRDVAPEARDDQDESLASLVRRLNTPAIPKTFYVIPGCYAGDVRPRAEQLPRGCQLALLREVPPVIAPAR